MTKKWSDIERDKDYISATDSQKQAIADGFFNDIIKPDIPSGQDVEAIKSQFMATARPPKPSVMERISAGLSDLVTPRTVVNPQKSAKPSTFKQDSQATDRLLPTVAADRVKEGQSRVIGQLVQQGYEPREAAEQALEIDAARVNKLNQDAVKPVDMSYAGPMREKPKRSLGDYFKDTAGSIVKIPGAVVRDVANIGNMVTGDSMPTDVAGTMQRGMDEFDRRYGSEARQFENQEFSRIAQDPEQDFTSQVDYLLENPTFLADQGITTVGSMFLPAGASAGALSILTRLTGGKVPTGIANALRSGTIAGTVAMQNAAETFNDPDMQDVPLEVRYEAAAITALGTLLGNKIFGGGVERAIADKFNKSGAAQGFALAAKEGGQEAFESLSQSSGKAVALPGSVTLNEAMGGALMEGAMGAVMGGGVAAVGMSGNSDNTPVDETINTGAGTMRVQSKGQQIIDFLKKKSGTAQPSQDISQSINKPQESSAITTASQAVNISDLLEEDNVSDATQGRTAGLDDGSGRAQPDNGNAGTGALPVLSDAGQNPAGAISGAGENATSDQSGLDAGNGDSEQSASLIDQKANEAATSIQNDLPEPTQAQKDAGNYKVGRIKVGGLDISVENPDQSARKGVDSDGKAWESTMNGHYGYVKGVKARAPDKEHIDVNVKAGTADTYAGDVFVINQKDPKTGKFDEPKVYIGYGNESEAEQAYRSNYAQDWQGFGDMVRLPMDKFKEMLGNEKAFLKPVKPIKTPKPRASKRANTLLSAIDSLGGIANKYKWDISGEQSFARAGYNKIFRNASTKTLEQHIENGDLDEFLPHEFRSTATDDPTAGRNYLADRIRNGDRVIPYDDQLRIDQERRDNRLDDDALDAIASMPQVGMFIDDDDDIGFGIGVELTPEESEAYWGAIDEGYDTAASSEQTEQPVAGDAPGSSVSDNEAPQESAPQIEIAGKTGSQERQGVREIVTAIVKRRAAANQIGKEKAFDGYLAAAKEFLNGKDIKPTEFKVASATFKNDPPLSEAFAQLAEIAKAPAKEARKNMRSAVDIFTEQINNAKTTEELRSIARNIQLETGVLSDSAAQQLDDLVMDKIDQLESFVLEAQTTDDIAAVVESEAKQKKEQARQDEADKKARIDAEIKARGAVAADSFELTQTGKTKEETKAADARTADEQIMGQKDIFSATAQEPKAKVGDIVETGGVKYRKTENGFELVASDAAENKAIEELIDDKPAPTKRPQPGEPGFTLEMAKDQLNRLYQQKNSAGIIESARLNDQISTFKKIVDEMVAQRDANDEKEKAKADLDSALSDLGDIFGKNFRASVTSEQEQKLIPVLTRLFDAAFRLGYQEFKQAAKFVLDTVREKIGVDVADAVTIDQLQGSYIAMAGKYGDKATSKRDVINVESLADIEAVQTTVDYVKNESAKTEEVKNNARTAKTGNVPDRSAQTNLFSEQSGSGDSEPVVSGVAGQSASPNSNESVSGSVQESGRERAPSVSRPAAASTPSRSRKTTDAADSTGTATSVDNFEITDEVDLGSGGLSKKYRDNIDAIKIIKALDSENRVATPEERLKLAKYAGFGALKGVFDKANKQWAKQYQELKELLTESEYESARASVLNAHYTSKEVVNTMFDVLRRLGFDGGRMLEPALGSGNFFGLMPASIRNKSQLNGVELDLLTSRLAKHLYPKANIAVATGFQDYVSPSGYFDVVIGNPPFGSEKVFDSQKSPYSGFSIHNYFLAKSIDKLREGGIMAVVVSHNFMDVNASPARDYIAKHANLLGAIRLPDTAFQQNAGTEVVTDIVFFQKTSNPVKDPDWLNSREMEITNPKTGEVSKAFVNDYFLGNPRMVLGRHSAAGTMYRGNNYTVEQTGDVAKMLKEAVLNLPVNKYVEPSQRIEVLDSADNTVPDGVKVGTYYADESGVIRQRLTDVLGQKRSQEWEAPNNGAIERMKAMMTLRDTLRTQMRLERDYQSSVDQIETNRKALNRRYDDFLKKFGYLNSSTNRRIFLDDTESALLQALELDYDQGVSKAKATNTGMEERPASAQKADIFKQRVLFPPSETISVSTAKDALLASLNEKGRVDIEFIADVYGKPVDEVVKELGDLVYEDPQAGYVSADEYLSGDVKTKLEEAKAAAKDEKKFKRSVEALEKVIPKDKLPSEIYVSVGANFVPAEVYSEFASEITGVPANKLNFTYVKATANWLSVNNGTGDAGKLTSDYGTDKINSFELFALMLNGKSPEIKYTVRLPGGSTETRTDVEGTEAARAKYQKIKETWESWVFAEPSRAERLSGIYNEKHNRIVARKYDGSHMTFPGMNPAIQLRPSQKNVVWRGIQDRNVLLDHVVGAGKTMAMASIAMEMKRLGISRKPIFAVPNHLTLQWRSEFTRLYPASNVLAATPEDFSKDKRERLFSKMVTGNYDAIIIGHSSLKKIGLPADVEERLYNDQINEIANAIEDMKRDRGDRSIIRDMEKIRTNLENKVKDLASKAGKRDDVVNFDEIGIDALFVDEMHEFKNLFFTTQMQRVSGLGNPKGSGKAFDMFMKIRWMNEAFGENAALISATGTPVSNSLSEMFTMQRYHKYDQMKRDDLHLFDAWAKQYGEVENVYEVAPSGVGYRQSTRFSKFKNLPSLMGSYTGFADIVTLQDLKDNASAAGLTFPVPKLRTGKPINVVAERSALQTAFFGIPKLATNESGDIQFEIEPENISIEQVEDKWQMLDKTSSAFIGEKYPTKEDAELDLVTKALTPKTFLDPESLLGKFANLRQLTRETKGKVNALSLTGLANKSGLDYRLIDPTAPDFAGSKINKAVDNMLADYKLWEKDKGTQIVFCDMSIPLSARNDMSSKEKRVYVRDRDNSITHKPKGVIYAVEGFEGFPFYLVKERDGIDVYEPVSGQIVTSRRFADKSEAKAYVNSMVEADSFADRIYSMRDQLSIDQAEIDEYRDAKELEVADDFSNEVTMTDLEAVAGSAQFSVYDDIKAKLMRKGIPENEIAFIHDFSTPKQKEDLFKRVNRGDVRFLFGSTPKLGAGTNVQQRLVGLHHIDAPWRPSDLEQREGRIIRQGNKLYERDPDGFEVAVYRYATEQTYDTRRWQLLEHKAAGIEQLRKYTGESEIEDVASEAANSADMKAAASGNPLILEETQLRTDKKRLENLQRAFSDSKLAMQRRITSNRNSVEQSLPERIAHYEEMNRLAEQFPVPEDKESTAKFKIESREITNKDKAEEALALLSAKVRQSYNEREERSFTYRGIEFVMERGWELGMMRLSAGDSHINTYLSKDKISPSGMITRLNNYIDSFSGRITQFQAEIVKLKAEAESLALRLDDPFEQAAELDDVRQKHVDVQRRLMKSTQLDAIPEEQLGEFKRILATRKQALKELGYATALKESERDSPSFSRNRNKLASQSEIDDLAKLFTNMASDSDVIKSLANKKAKKHPMAEAINKVESEFYDMLGQLEDADLIKINC